VIESSEGRTRPARPQPNRKAQVETIMRLLLDPVDRAQRKELLRLLGSG
jgi:hypothetical protein